MNNRIILWHECPVGNNFASYADENIQCPDCGVTEEMPRVRNIYTKETPLELCEPRGGRDKYNFEMLVGYEQVYVGGQNG
jgi:hypothetical protein